MMRIIRRLLGLHDRCDGRIAKAYTQNGWGALMRCTCQSCGDTFYEFRIPIYDVLDDENA